MAASFSINHVEAGTTKVLDIHGYFADEAGAALEQAVEELLHAGVLSFVLDFSSCNVISSPGIAALMDITLKITEDFQGKVALCGLDDLQRKVLNMAGIINIAAEGGSREAAVALVA